MVKRDNPQKSNQAAARALEEARKNPIVSDFRKDKEVFKFLMSGRSPIGEIDDYVSAILRDYVCGYINGDDVTAHIAPIDSAVRVKMLELRLGMVQKRARVLPSGSVIEGEVSS